MNKEEKEAVQELKVLIGLEEFNKLSYKENQAIDILLNYIDKLQKENEDMREELQMYVDTPINKLVVENEQLQADKNKLINYIAIREEKTYEEVCKEFELGE